MEKEKKKSIDPTAKLIKDGYVRIIPQKDLAKGSWQQENYDRFSPKFQEFNPCPRSIIRAINKQEAIAEVREINDDNCPPLPTVGEAATAQVIEIVQTNAA
jgi:hypothetical protein